MRNSLQDIAGNHAAALDSGDQVVEIGQPHHTIEISLRYDLAPDHILDPRLRIAVFGRKVTVATAALKAIDPARAVTWNECLQQFRPREEAGTEEHTEFGDRAGQIDDDAEQIVVCKQPCHLPSADECGIVDQRLAERDLTIRDDALELIPVLVVLAL